MQTKQNYGGLDRFRVAAALLVIAIHTSPLASISDGADFFLTRILARIAVPFFLMVTGQFVVADFLEPSARSVQKLKKYLKKTALLYAFCIILYLPIGIYAGHYEAISIDTVLRMLVFDGTFYHLWYFPACILGVALVYLMSIFMGKRAVTVVSAILYIIGLFGDSYYGLLGNVPILKTVYDLGFQVFSYTRNGLFFAPLFLVLGAWIGTLANLLETKSAESDNPENADISDKKTSLLFFGGAILCFVNMTAEAFVLRHFEIQRHDSMYLALVPTMLLLYLCLLCLPQKPVREFRTGAMWIYILHPAFIVVVRGAAKVLGLTDFLVNNSILHYITVALLSVAAGFLMVYIQKYILPRLLSVLNSFRQKSSKKNAERQPDTPEESTPLKTIEQEIPDTLESKTTGADIIEKTEKTENSEILEKQQTSTEEVPQKSITKAEGIYPMKSIKPKKTRKTKKTQARNARNTQASNTQTAKATKDSDISRQSEKELLVEDPAAKDSDLLNAEEDTLIPDLEVLDDVVSMPAAMAGSDLTVPDLESADDLDVQMSDMDEDSIVPDLEGGDGLSEQMSDADEDSIVPDLEGGDILSAQASKAEGAPHLSGSEDRDSMDTPLKKLLRPQGIHGAMPLRNQSMQKPIFRKAPNVQKPGSFEIRQTQSRLRAWIELDSEALAHNVDFLRSRLPERCRLMPAVKAEAYGHGAVLIARQLNRLNVNAFCVACLSEAVALRKAGIKGKILILGITPPEDFPLLKRYQLTQTVVDYSYAQTLNRFGQSLPVHIGIDTGMHRLGIRCENLEEIMNVCEMSNLVIDGFFTHLSASDSLRPEDRAFTDSQVQAFYQVIDILKSHGYPCPGLHLLSSYGILNLLQEKEKPEKYLRRSAASHGISNRTELAADYVRPGIALYGLLSTEADSNVWRDTLQPVLSLKAKVISLRPLYAGEAAGYGIAFTARHDMQIATISIGYADGLPRELSYGIGSVLINGAKAPIIGRICMDQTLVDVSNVPNIKTGNTAVIIGKSGELEITADHLAEQCGTITNEILSRLGARLDRIMV